MPVELKNRINKAVSTLQNNLLLDDILPELVKYDVITATQERVLPESNDIERNAKFLELFKCRPEQSFHAFVKVLQDNNQGHLVRDMIMTEQSSEARGMSVTRIYIIP